MLYVGGNSGVYQSTRQRPDLDALPRHDFGAVAEGGNLPHVAVTSLSLSLGNIDSNTGMPNLAGPYNPNPVTGATAGPRRAAGHDLRPGRVRHQSGAADPR